MADITPLYALPPNSIRGTDILRERTVEESYREAKQHIALLSNGSMTAPIIMWPV